MRKNKRVPFKLLGRGFDLPCEFLNSWPAILDSMNAEIEIIERNIQKAAPRGFQHVLLTMKRGSATVSLESMWLSEQRYIIHLQLGRLETDLVLAKEIEALLTSNGCEGHTPPLSQFDDCVDW